MPLCICWYWFHRRQRLHSGPSGEGASSDGREVVGLQRGGPQSSDLEGNVYVYVKKLMKINKKGFGGKNLNMWIFNI